MFQVNRTATVIAKTKCIVAVLTAGALKSKCQMYPELRDMIYKEAQDRLQLLTRELEKAGKKFQTEPSDRSGAMRKVGYPNDRTTFHFHSS